MWSGNTLTKLNAEQIEQINKTAKMLKEAKYEKKTKVKKAKAILSKAQYTSLNALRDLCMEEAKAKGWHSNATPDIGAFCSNLHGEVSELWEQYRNETLNSLCNKSDKMEENGIDPLTGAEEELADVLIRTLDFFSALNIDVGKAINSKLLYNRTRPHRHGNKIA